MIRPDPAKKVRFAFGPAEWWWIGESWPTAAIPLDNPHCSCQLTRVRPDTAERKALAKLAASAGTTPTMVAAASLVAELSYNAFV